VLEYGTRLKCITWYSIVDVINRLAVALAVPSSVEIVYPYTLRCDHEWLKL
jgi:hypothetical protein